MTKIFATLSATAVLCITMGAPMAVQAADASAVKRCVSCHTFEAGEKHKSGPNLFGVFTRPAGTAEGFRYGKGMQEARESIGMWDDEKMDAYLTDPTKYFKSLDAGRSRMSFKVRKAEDRAAAIEYMKTLK